MLRWNPRISLSVFLNAAALVLMLSLVYSYAGDRFGVTKLRNSLIAEAGIEKDFVWTPDSPPKDFHLEQGEPPEVFLQLRETLFAHSSPAAGEFEKALALGSHLSQGPGPGGGGILADTLTAYKEIMTSNRGYCADYTQVMNGLSYAGGIPIREWGLSFDGFGGDGHTFSEIYDSGLRQWIFLDTFYSFYVRDRASGRPLSVLDLRRRLAAGEDESTLEVVVVDPEQFGFKSAEAALNYYRRGSDQFFLWYGNDVLTYDNHPVIRTITELPFIGHRLSRSLEQGIAIAMGIHPRFRIFTTGTNRPLIDSLFFLRQFLLVTASATVILTLSLLLQMSWLLRRRA